MKSIFLFLWMVWLGCLSSEATGQTEPYTLDPAHTFVQFSVERFTMIDVVGRFNEVSGTVNWHADEPQKTTGSLIIQTESVDTGHEIRDGHLKMPMYLNTEAHPTSEIAIKALRKIDESWTVLVDFTFLGTTKALEIPVRVKGPFVDPTKKKTLAFSGAFEVDRLAYGMKMNKTFPDGQPFIGNQVMLEFSMLFEAE